MTHALSERKQRTKAMNDAETTMLLRGATLVLADGVVKGKSFPVERGLIARIADEDQGKVKVEV